MKNMIMKNKPFCVHLRDDFGGIYYLMMAAAHEYKHFAKSGDEIIENAALSILIGIFTKIQ